MDKITEKILIKIKEIEKLLKGEEKTINKKCRVKKRENYFFLDGRGTVSTQETYSEFDDGNYLNGNYFSTLEEAKKTLDKIRIYTKLKRFAEKHNIEEINWKNDNQSKYYICYDYKSEELHFSNVWDVKDIGQIYFTDFYLAEQAIEEIGEEEIKKLFE